MNTNVYIKIEDVFRIKKMLQEFSIKTGKTYEIKDNFNPRYRFYISGKQNLKKFNKEIGFDHTANKMKTIVENRNKKWSEFERSNSL